LIDQRNRDAATIIVNAQALPFPATTLPLLESSSHLKIGVEVGWVGFPAIAPINFCFFSGPISFFIEDESSYLIDGVAINGVSGGPVFRKLPNEPELVGIVSAYKANRRATDTLPGLLVAQDITPVHEHIQQINNLDEAKETEEKQKQEQKQEQKQQEMKPANSEEIKEN
jgi:hypothetical protein